MLLLLLTFADAAAQLRGAVALHDRIAGLGVTARVLVVGAHPDDEDTRLITWLARARHVETAYLSLTRGDGGQNLIGNELGEALGVIRTEELLAARRIDGARQYFARAYDFGFSKSAEETFRHWPRDSLIRDVVTVVRAFRPHVIVSVFSGTLRDGHGQHQVAGLLAREAYDAAGDTIRFPRSINAAKLEGWTPLKFYRGGGTARESPTLCFNVGVYDHLAGESYAEIAARSRSQHKSQAFGALQRKGVSLDCVRREGSRVNESTDPKAEKSILDGIDPTWARVRAQVTDARARVTIDSLSAALADAQRQLDLRDPTPALSALARATALAQSLCTRVSCAGEENGSPAHGQPGASDLAESARVLIGRANDALRLAAAVDVEAEVERELLALGDTATVAVAVYNRGRVPISVRQLSAGGSDTRAEGSGPASAEIQPDSVWRGRLVLRAGRATRPWWLETARTADLFAVPVSVTAENARSAPAEVRVALRIAGGELTVVAPVVRRLADPVRGDISRPLAVAPAIAVTLDRTVEYAPANTRLERRLRVQLRSVARDARTARVSLKLPPGLIADLTVLTVSLPGYGSVRTTEFLLRGTLPHGEHAISVVAESDGERFESGFVPIEYEHVRPQRIVRDAVLRVQAVDVKLPPRIAIAYVPGVGDNVAPMLQQLGVPLTVLEPAALPRADLSRYTAVVVGPRAYEASDQLVANNARLLDYTRAGGTLVVQYGQQEMAQPGIMPFPITHARPPDRVTDEDAPVTILEPRHPLVTTPNRISASDFERWVQERGLYIPRTFAPEYTALLEVHDPGEPPRTGALLVASLGRGTYVYTTLAFFRQMPAGNPGAARLFVNLLGGRQRAVPVRGAIP